MPYFAERIISTRFLAKRGNIMDILPQELMLLDEGTASAVPSCCVAGTESGQDLSAVARMAKDDDRGPRDMPRLLAIIAATVGILLFGAWSGMLGPLLPGIATSFHMPVDITGLLLGVTYTGAVLSVVIGGYLADHFGKKPLFLVALGGLGIAFFLFATAPAFWAVAIACFLGGAVGGTLEGLCGAMIADIDHLHVGRNMILLQVAFCAGAVLALIITSRSLSTLDAWRTVYLVLAGACVLLWLLSLLMRVPPAPPAEHISLAQARKVVSDPFVLLLALAIMLYVGSEMSLGEWGSYLFSRSMAGIGNNAMAGSWLFWLSMGIGRLVVGLGCQRYRDDRVLAWLVRGGLTAYVILLLPAGAWHYWAGVCVAGFTFSAIWPLIVSQGNSYYPGYSGTVVSMLVASGTLGALIFPAISGFVIERASPFMGIVLMAVLFCALAVVMEYYTISVKNAARRSESTGQQSKPA